MKKNKVLKKGNLLEKKQKREHVKKIFISLFVAIIMVSSILAITLSGNNQNTEKFNGYKFTRTSSGYWITKINGNQYQFQTLPKNIIYYFLNKNNITLKEKEYTDKELIELNKKTKEFEITNKMSNAYIIEFTTDINSLVDFVGSKDEEITQSEYYFITSLENSKYVLSDLLQKKGKYSYSGSYYSQNIEKTLNESKILSGYTLMKKISCDSNPNNDQNTTNKLTIVFKPTIGINNIKTTIKNNCITIEFSSLNDLNYFNEYVMYSILNILKEE